jgi:hypothetical protein
VRERPTILDRHGQAFEGPGLAARDTRIGLRRGAPSRRGIHLHNGVQGWIEALDRGQSCAKEIARQKFPLKQRRAEVRGGVEHIRHGVIRWKRREGT